MAGFGIRTRRAAGAVGIVLALALGGASATSARAAAFDRAAWLADYAALKAAIERTDANLSWYATPQGGADLPALNRRTRRALDEAADDAEARRAIEAFITGVGRQGHLSELPRVTAGVDKAAEPAEPSLSPGLAVQGCAALGYASDGRVAFTAPFESLPGFSLESDGETQAFRAGVLTLADGRKIGLVRVQSFHMEAYPATCLEAWPKAGGHDLKVGARAVREQAALGWFADLSQRLRRFRAEGVSAVLVDIGHNTGGNNSGDIAAYLVTARPLRAATVLMVRSPVLDGYVDGQIDNVKEVLTAAPDAGAATTEALRAALAGLTQARAEMNAPACDMSWVWREQRPWGAGGCRPLVAVGTAAGAVAYLPAGAIADPKVERRVFNPAAVGTLWGSWNGPLYVLTDARTYSAAEMFAATLQDNGAARIVGTRTGQDGCGFMTDADPIVLPRSGLRLRSPDCVRLRRDGGDEVAGVTPDLPIDPIEGESERARAQRILAAIAADLR